MLRRVVWCKFTDVSEVFLPPSSGRFVIAAKYVLRLSMSEDIRSRPRTSLWSGAWAQEQRNMPSAVLKANTREVGMQSYARLQVVCLFI
jgi:hypothetical protein